jgi:hypothetical protein
MIWDPTKEYITPFENIFACFLLYTKNYIIVTNTNSSVFVIFIILCFIK